MAISAHLPGRLQNSSLSPTHGLYPLYEAVVNSIRAIEEAGRPGVVTITIDRAAEQPDVEGVGAISFAKIKGFTIVDNGVGFDSANFTSFETMDSRAKATLGGKGVGRLLWLLAFERARIVSIFEEGGKRWHREFEFEPSVEGVVKHSLVEIEDGELSTTVELINLLPSFAARLPKNPNVIARRIIDHCLAYFVLGTAPKIRLIDSQTAEMTDLLQLFNSEIMGGATVEDFTTKGEPFRLTHVKVAAGSGMQHKVHFCANQRTVASEQLIGRIPNLMPALTDNGEQRPFVYCGYLAGPYLDRKVNADRTAFTIPEEDVFGEGVEPTWPDIVDGCMSQASGFLAPYTAPIGEIKNERVRVYVETKAPRYRHVLKNRAQVLDKIPATAGDDRIDLELYRAKQTYEHELQVRYHELLKENDPKALALDQYEEAFRKFIEEWNEAGMAALAEHVMLRSATLRFLDSRRTLQESGKYLLEEAIHQVIFPLKATSDDLPPEKMNLWIIDERLAYHHYLASDLPFSEMAAIESDSEDRPDIVIFNNRSAFVDSMTQFQSVALIEFKKPGRNDYKEDTNPFNQVYKYVRKIREGRAKDRRGVYMHVSEHTPFYAHVICDLSPALRQQIENYDFTPTPDGAGYFNFNSQLRVWIEVISFDKLIDDAKRRNAVFFEKLGVQLIG